MCIDAQRMNIKNAGFHTIYFFLQKKKIGSQLGHFFWWKEGWNFYQPPNFWSWLQNRFQKWHIFLLFHAYNSKMLFRPFFNRFGSNFHQPPNFLCWLQNHFQKWHFFSVSHLYLKNGILAIFNQFGTLTVDCQKFFQYIRME